MEAREPGQVRKEAALSGNPQAHRGCRTGVPHRTAPRADTTEEGARSTSLLRVRLRGRTGCRGHRRLTRGHRGLTHLPDWSAAAITGVLAECDHPAAARAGHP